MEIIGISGKAGSGKDYIGKHVLEPLGYKKWALAWPMKNEALGENRNWTHDMVHVTKPPLVRAFLQKRGTEDGWMKHDMDYWLRIAAGWMMTMEQEWGVSKFYIPDVRFPHEVTFIRDVLQGRVFRIVSDRRNNLTPEQQQHTSETALDGWTNYDGYIQNYMAFDTAGTLTGQVLLHLGLTSNLKAECYANGQYYWRELMDPTTRAEKE